MAKIASLLTLFVTVLVCLLPAISAHAAARDRVFVASYGSDSNPCTFGSPCKTFQQAVNVVAVGGEITAIDSAGFGPVTVNQSVTITSPNGVEAGIQAAAGGTAITINAPGSSVVLSGLTINGADVGGIGIQVNAANLEVVNCAVRGFTNGVTANGTGIILLPAAQMNFLISNTIVADNSFGIYYQNNGSGISGSINGVIDHVVATNNSRDGISIISEMVGEPTYVTISNTTSSNNGGSGLSVGDTVAGRFIVDVDSSYFNNNHSDGVVVSGVSSTVMLFGRSVVTGNGGMGIEWNPGFTVATYGDNRINWNGTGDLSFELDNTDDTLR
jgi:hypothetical protein